MFNVNAPFNASFSAPQRRLPLADLFSPKERLPHVSRLLAANSKTAEWIYRHPLDTVNVPCAPKLMKETSACHTYTDLSSAAIECPLPISRAIENRLSSSSMEKISTTTPLIGADNKHSIFVALLHKIQKLGHLGKDLFRSSFKAFAEAFLALIEYVGGKLATHPSEEKASDVYLTAQKTKRATLKDVDQTEKMPKDKGLASKAEIKAMKQLIVQLENTCYKSQLASLRALNLNPTPSEEMKMLREVQLFKADIQDMTNRVKKELSDARVERRQQARGKEIPGSLVHAKFTSQNETRVKELVADIKLNKPGDAMVIQEVATLQEISRATQDAQKVFQSLLYNYHHTQVACEIQDDGTLRSVTFTLQVASSKKQTETIVLLAEDFQQINCQQIEVKQEDLEQYERIYLDDNTSLIQKDRFVVNCRAQDRELVANYYSAKEKAADPTGNYSQLHLAHKLAIAAYTGHSYVSINSSFRGIYLPPLPPQVQAQGARGEEAFKQGFLHGVVAEQALAKMPIVEPENKFVYRGEQESVNARLLMDKYKAAVTSGQPLIVRQGILSTGKSGATPGFSNPQTHAGFLIIKGQRKKNAKIYSLHPQEEERLFSERNLCIQGFKEYNVNGKQIVYFIAKVVDEAVVYGKETQALLPVAKTDAGQPIGPLFKAGTPLPSNPHFSAEAIALSKSAQLGQKEEMVAARVATSIKPQPQLSVLATLNNWTWSWLS